MALNKEILRKLDEKTKDKDEIKNFLVDILQIESEANPPGQFNKVYSFILEKHCEEGYKK